MAEPIETLRDGTTIIRYDKLTDSERAYVARYRVLTPEQQRELEEFAAYLKAKARRHSGGEATREGDSNG